MATPTLDTWTRNLVKSAPKVQNPQELEAWFGQTGLTDSEKQAVRYWYGKELPAETVTTPANQPSAANPLPANQPPELDDWTKNLIASAPQGANSSQLEQWLAQTGLTDAEKQAIRTNYGTNVASSATVPYTGGEQQAAMAAAQAPDLNTDAGKNLVTRKPLSEAVGADGKPLTGIDLFNWANDNGYSSDEALALVRGSGATTTTTGTTGKAGTATTGSTGTTTAGTTATGTTAGTTTGTTATTVTEPAKYEFDEATAKAIEEFYRKPYEESADKRLKQAEATLRQVGMFDSGTRGMAALENVRKTSTEISQNVTIPLIQAEQDRAYAREKDRLAYELEVATKTGNINGQATVEQQLADLEAKKQKNDIELSRAEASGILPVTAADLGVDFTTGDSEEKRATLYRNFEAQYGRAPTAAEIQALVTGSGVIISGQTVTLAGRQVAVSERSQTWQEAIDRANQVGSLTDPDTGVSVSTLSKWKMQLDEAGVTGIYQGEPTLANKMATWDQTSSDKAIFGFDEERTVNGVTQTVHVYGTNELQQVLQKSEQDFEKMVQAGYTYVDPDTGETRRVLGTDERNTTAYEREEATRSGYDKVVTGADGKPLYEQKAVLATFDAAGNRVYDKTQAEVIAAGGSVRTIYEQGNPVMQHVEGTQEASTRIQEAAQELQEKGLSQEDAHFQATMAWDKQQRDGYYKVRGVTFDQLGLAQEDLDALALAGVDWSRWNKADGSGVDFDAFFAWADDPLNADVARIASALVGDPNNAITGRLRAVLGRNPSQQEVQDLLTGKVVAALDESGNPRVDYITGTVGLEQEKNQLAKDLQANGFKQDEAMAIADRTYQDKVREGYWTTNSSTGARQWVYGTQTQQERLMTLQRDLNLTEQEAQNKWTEDQRVGYDEVQEYTLPNGQKASRTVHITGTQEQVENMTYGYFRQVKQADGTVRSVWEPGSQDHELELQQMRDNLVREGWAADAAMQQAQYIQSQSGRDSDYFMQTYQSQREWYYQNVEGMPAQQAKTAAAADATEMKGQFGTGLQETLAQMQIDAADSRFDAQTQQDYMMAALTAIGGISGDVVSLLLGDDGLAGLVSTGGAVTAALLRRLGVSEAEITRITGVVSDATGGSNGLSNAWLETQNLGLQPEVLVDLAQHTGPLTDADLSLRYGITDPTKRQTILAHYTGNTATGYNPGNVAWGPKSLKGQVVAGLSGFVAGVVWGTAQNEDGYEVWAAQNPQLANGISLAQWGAAIAVGGPWGGAAFLLGLMAKADGSRLAVGSNISPSSVNLEGVTDSQGRAIEAGAIRNVFVDFANESVYLEGQTGQRLKTYTLREFFTLQDMAVMPVDTKDIDLNEVPLDVRIKDAKYVVVKERPSGSGIMTYDYVGENGQTLWTQTDESHKKASSATQMATFRGSYKLAVTDALTGANMTMQQFAALRGRTGSNMTALPSSLIDLWKALPYEYNDGRGVDKDKTTYTMGEQATIASDLWNAYSSVYPEDARALTGQGA